MLFRILGPPQVDGDGMRGSPLRRAILTALLLRAGQSVGITELTDLLWDSPPSSARANIRSHLTGLRRDLEDAGPGLSRRVRTHRGSESSYELQVSADECDLTRFVRAAQHGRSLLLRGAAAQAIGELEEALALWRGPFGLGLPATRWFNAHVTGVNDARVLAYQDLFTARLLADRTELLSYRIESVLAEWPYRQRLWELLAATYCADGDAVGALTVIRRCHALFADDLGLDLPPNVAAIQTAALSWDRDQALRLVGRPRPEPDA